MRRLLIFFVYAIALLLPIVLVGALGFYLSLRMIWLPEIPADVHDAAVPQAAPAHDVEKPTVAVLLGDVTEITDALGPYALFAESALYNVYMVAETRDVYRLTGGLDIVPHYSFDELDRLLGRSPDIVVLPYIPNIQSPINQPLIDWLKQQQNQETVLFSWCIGAQVLAEAGLLDGKVATSHWAFINGLESSYPAVDWQRGVRYVDQGNILTSAGITSGIDATLYLLKRLHGGEVAERVAAAIHYPSLQFVDRPAMQEYERGFGDAIFALNMAFGWPKQRTGVWLYDGVGDLDLAAAFDVYGTSSLNRAYSMAGQPSVRSKHGLQLIPRTQIRALPRLDQLLLPDGIGMAKVAATLDEVQKQVSTPLTQLVDPTTPTFVFEYALEQFAQMHNVPTARFTAKRLEYRADSLQLSGGGWALWPLIFPLLLGGLGVGTARWLRSRRSLPIA